MAVTAYQEKHIRTQSGKVLKRSTICNACTAGKSSSCTGTPTGVTAVTTAISVTASGGRRKVGSRIRRPRHI